MQLLTFLFFPQEFIGILSTLVTKFQPNLTCIDALILTRAQQTYHALRITERSSVSLAFAPFVCVVANGMNVILALE